MTPTPVVKDASVAHYMEACIHAYTTLIADDLFGAGDLTREERIALSGALGSALGAFGATVAESAPGLYARSVRDSQDTPSRRAEDPPYMPRSQSTIAPLDMPTLYPAVNKTFAIAKVDEAQHLVFGWASVATDVDGENLVDAHGDIIEPTELEPAAYQFVKDHGTAGELHTGGPVGRIVESVVFTPEKVAAMGLDHPMPIGWWIGMKVDPVVFAKVRSGDYRMFSIQGTAVRDTP